VKCKYIAEFAAVIAAQPSSLALDLQIQMTAFAGLTRELVLGVRSHRLMA
jgi:hypothetical protein